ncbi:DUF1127 domain-containing protein [Dickeya zeae]|uniref:DUF1127 domain-containing protein n=1 Tax=Dickeya zeae TaxID=204042 RepID=UPI0003A67A34|nr:DUF1127 domain-containing protein [Dickeya zeae]UJR52786.1 DUF1127 domain-containing protein [Dickeya zeae MS1]
MTQHLTPRSLLQRLYHLIQSQYQRHQTRKILNALDDSRLRDIGLTRQDIRHL